MTDYQPSPQAAERGEPSYIWRAGRQRRLDMINAAAGKRIEGKIMEAGCGIGLYLEHLIPLGGKIIGFEYDLPVRFIKRTVIFWGYDNIISRFPRFGPWLRSILYLLEKTPLRLLGLSQFWVVEKNKETI